MREYCGKLRAKMELIERKILRRDVLSADEAMEMFRAVLRLQATVTFLRGEIRFANSANKKKGGGSVSE